MSPTSHRPHALAETVAAYGDPGSGASHTKLSISLPSPLVDEIRMVADASGQSVSGVIAAAVRSAIAREEQALLDTALDAQNEENLAWAAAYGPLAAKLWSNLEW
jgi:predicted transcriptional regulator